MRKLFIVALVVAISGIADAAKVATVSATESCGASNDPDPTSTDAGLSLSDGPTHSGIPSNVVTYVTVALTGNAYTPSSDGGVEKIAYGTMRAWRYTRPGAGWTRWPSGDVSIDAYYNPDGGSGARQTWMSKEIPINIAGDLDRIWFTTEDVQTVADAGTISVQVEGQFSR